MVWIAEKSSVGGGIGREDSIGRRHRMAQLRAENSRDVTEDISGWWDGAVDSRVGIWRMAQQTANYGEDGI